MFIHPDLALEQVHQHQRELIDQAEQGRLLSAALRRRRRLRKRGRRPALPASVEPYPEGNLAGCEEHAPAQVR